MIQPPARLSSSEMPPPRRAAGVNVTTERRAPRGPRGHAGSRSGCLQQVLVVELAKTAGYDKGLIWQKQWWLMETGWERARET